MKREFLLGLMDQMPKEVVDAIMEENGRDIQAAKQAAREWEERYNQAVTDHETQVARLEFDALLREEISQAGGRNHKAITALLDTQALQESKDPGALKEAVEAVKKECGYLFRTPGVPMYASGTGAQTGEVPAPESLAQALRERFDKG